MKSIVAILAIGGCSSSTAPPVTPAPATAPIAPASTAEPAPAVQPPVEDPPPPPPEPVPPDTSGLDLVDGRYKITRLISLGSSHATTTVPATLECLTKAAPLPDAVPGWPAGTTCKPNYLVDGRTFTWAFSCAQGTTTIEGGGPLGFEGKKFSGTIKVEKTTRDGGGIAGQRGVMKIAGTYVGPCPATGT